MAFSIRQWFNGQNVTAADLQDMETRLSNYTDSLLSSTTLGSDGTFDVSSIDQSYTDLVIVAIIRGTDAGSADGLRLRFNNDSGANYDWQQNAFFGGSSSLSAGTAAAHILTSQIPAGGATANYFGMYQILIPGYTSTAWVKRTVMPMAMYEVTAGTAASCANVGLWRSTAAINRIQFSGLTTANLKTGSQLRIYGRM